MTWTLSITKEEFKNLYGSSVDSSIFESVPKSTEDLIINFLSSKLWRLNNLYSIINKKGELVLFRMNKAQHVVYAASLEHPRLIILKSRQQGISTFWLIYFFDDALTIPNLNIGLMAQGKDEAGTLLDRVKIAWENIDPEIQQFLNVVIVRDNTGELKFNIKTTIFIRTSFRSATLQRLHVSEYGKICAENPKRAKETKTGTLQSISPGNIVVIESTAEGANDYKRMWDTATEREIMISNGTLDKFSGKDFKPVFLSWLYDPDCLSPTYEVATTEQTKYFDDLEIKLNLVISQKQRNFWIAQWRELGEDTYQEYPAIPEEAFRRTNKGTYYAHAYTQFILRHKREIVNLYDVNLEVNVALDLGVDEDDFFYMLFFQRYGNEWRMINEYFNVGALGLEHFVEHMRELEDGPLKYRINKVVCPHDIRVRELGAGGRTREQSLRKLGVEDILTIDKTGSVAADIELVRQTIPNMWIDPSTCPQTIKCFKNYARMWDERAGTWAKKANHNEWSHGADAIRAMVKSGVERVASKEEMIRERKQLIVDGVAM